MHLTIPVTPDAETAREWAVQELSRSAYHHSQSLADRIGEWIMDFLARLLDTSAGASFPPVGYIIGTLALVGLVLAAARVTLPAIRQRRRGGAAVLADDDDRTSAQMRDAAAAAARAGDHTTATLEHFRALVRGCEERVIIDERAGRTAREAAHDIGTAVGEHAHELRRGAATFDALCYGHRAGAESDALAMATLDATLLAAKPSRMVIA